MPKNRNFSLHDRFPFRLWFRTARPLLDSQFIHGRRIGAGHSIMTVVTNRDCLLSIVSASQSEPAFRQGQTMRTHTFPTVCLRDPLS